LIFRRGYLEHKLRREISNEKAQRAQKGTKKLSKEKSTKKTNKKDSPQSALRTQRFGIKIKGKGAKRRI
jgi:hypothetical protein